MDSQHGQDGADPYFSHVPFSRRWECHKSRIVTLYMNEKLTLDEVAETMKTQYRFDASVRQYKYHLKKWNTNKAVPSAVKDKAITAIRNRTQKGMAVGHVRYKGTTIDKKRIQRYLQDLSKRDQDWTLVCIVFGQWNLPYKALKASLQSEASPFSPQGFTPSDISISSPQRAQIGMSPAAAPSPINAPTPTTMAVRAKTYEDRARYLVHGKNEEFLKDMVASEKRVATTWLYQYWLFAFRTAKYWGKGPRKWSFELLRFDEFPDVNSTPNTPATLGGIPEDHVMSGTEIGIGPNVRGIEYEPLLLCRWSIHCHVPCYEGVRSALPETEDIDLSNPRAWRTWQEGMIPSDMIRCLQEALSMNSFSSINAKDLPLSASYVAGAASRSPDTLKLEAFCFAIMARNEELLWELVEEVAMEDLDLTKLFPFHLAANFLDGTMGCCNILGLFATSLCKKNLLHKNYVNDLGHTVLDSLMISILKSHTSCTPQDVDIRYLQPQRFPGEEVDICGRWDADSDCVRAMNAKGSPKIPFEWKHMFCHTSAQAICHSISAIFSGDYSPDINTPSGLFLKCCGNCNTKLQLLPLHTLVLTTFYLAQRGCEGENLFGALACLMGLLVHGANPLQKAELSIDALIGFDSGELCNHSPIDPLSLAERVPKDIVSTWSGEARVGWDVFLSVLRFAQTERHLDATPIWPGNSSRAPCAHAGYGNNFYGRSPMLGTLWAAIQTELLTYRRLEESDPWLSDRFSMRGIPLSLSFDNGSMSMPLTEQNMMKPFCKCGRFPGATFLECPTTEDVCEYYFSNLEDWHRSEFLTIPRYAKELDGPGLDESDSEDYDQTWSDSEG